MGHYGSSKDQSGGEIAEKTAFRDKIYKKIKETTGDKIKKNYEKNVKESKKQGTLVNQ